MGLKDFSLKIDSCLFAEISLTAKAHGLTPASFVELCVRNTLYEKLHTDFDQGKLYTTRAKSLEREAFEVV